MVKENFKQKKTVRSSLLFTIRYALDAYVNASQPDAVCGKVSNRRPRIHEQLALRLQPSLKSRHHHRTWRLQFPILRDCLHDGMYQVI